MDECLLYNYGNGNNQLTSITKDITGQPTYATYSYDLNGQMTSEAIGDGSAISKYMVYDLSGKVTAVYQDIAHTLQIVGFVYDETGERIKKLSYNNSNQLYKVTYYVGDVIYTQLVTGSGTVYGNAVVQEYQITGGTGRLGVYDPQGPIYAYELSDHLGNVRAVIAQNGSTCQVRMYTDYYPFGMVINRGGTDDYKYGYQGQNAEEDQETGWNNFELRMYDSRIARWLQYDPMGQFYSPYLAMGNDLIKSTDPNGGQTDDYYKNSKGEIIYDDKNTAATICWNNDEWQNIGKSYNVMDGIFTLGTWQEDGTYKENKQNSYQGTISNYTPTFWQSEEKNEMGGSMWYGFFNSLHLTIQNLGYKQLHGRSYALNLDGSVSTPNENVDAFAQVGLDILLPEHEALIEDLKALKIADPNVFTNGFKGVYVYEYLNAAGTRLQYVGKSIDIVKRIYQHVYKLNKNGGTMLGVTDIYALPTFTEEEIRQFEQMIIDSKGGVKAGTLGNKINSYDWSK